MATTTTRATKTAATLEPLYAIVLANGGREVITDVLDRRSAREGARQFNRDHACDGLRARVRPVALRFA